MQKQILEEGLRLLVPNKLKTARVTAANNSTGFYTVDSERIALVNVVFNEAWAKEDAHVDLLKIKHALQNLKSDEIIMEITTKKTILTGNVQEFELNNFNIDTAPSPYHAKLSFKGSAFVPRLDIVQFLKAAGQISDSFTIRIAPEGVTLRAASDGGDEVELKLPKDMLYELDVGEVSIAKYPIEWPLTFVNTLKDGRVWIYMNQDFPMRLYSKNKYFEAEMFVAPRIESND